MKNIVHNILKFATAYGFLLVLCTACIAIDYLDSENTYEIVNNSQDSIVLCAWHHPYTFLYDTINDTLLYKQVCVQPLSTSIISYHYNYRENYYKPSDAIESLHILSLNGDTLYKQVPIDNTKWKQQEPIETINQGWYVVYTLQYP